jgi:hypothetical protein
MQVSCLRWHSSGLYACALEPASAYSLGFAAEPTQGFVPLWQRANTCRDACTSEAPLEMRCRDPWDAIAPLLGAETAVCDANASMWDAGVDAGSAGVATEHDAATVVDASRTTPNSAAISARSAHGCTVASPRSLSTPWWLAAMLLLAGSCRNRILRAQRMPDRRADRERQR